MSQKIIFVEGPDGCGKTEISRALSKRLKIPYFKVSTEVMNWKNGTFKNSLPFDALLPQFVQQTGVSFIADRGYPSEAVYSTVFARETDWDLLDQIDEQYSALGATIVLLYRRDYSNVRFDELVEKKYLKSLHDTYENFSRRTKCKVVKMYVDDYKNDLNLEIPVLVEELGIL